MFCEDAVKAASRFGRQSKSELTEKTMTNIKQRLVLKVTKKSNALKESKGFSEFIPVSVPVPVRLLHILRIITCEPDFHLSAHCCTKT
jgi:hypothetical protein